MTERLLAVISVAVLSALFLQVVLPQVTATSARSWGAKPRRALFSQIALPSLAAGALGAVVRAPDDPLGTKIALVAACVGAAIGFGIVVERYRTLRRVVAMMPALRDPE